MIPDFPFRSRYSYAVPSLSSESIAQVDLNPSLRSIIIPPSQQKALGDAVGCIEFPIIFAGRLQKTSTGAAFRILQRDMEQTLYKIYENKLDVSTGGTRMAEIDDGYIELMNQCSTVIQSSTCAFLSWLSEDQEYIDWYANSYADNLKRLDPSDVQNKFNSVLSECIQEYSDPDLKSEFRDVIDQYGVDTFQTIVKTALDPDLKPLSEQEGVHAQTTTMINKINSLDLIQRCRIMIDSLSKLNNGLIETSPAQIQEELRERVNESKLTDVKRESRSGIERTLVNDLPLITIPANLVKSNKNNSGLLDFVGYPTGQAWLFTRVFEAGRFAAAVYRRAGGGSTWLVNPFIPTDEENKTYAALWEQAFVADQITSQVFNKVDSDTRSASIHCPLCSLSSGYCSIDKCAYHRLRIGIEDLLPELIHVIKKVK